IVLYYAPIACSLVPYVTLNEAGADFEVRPISIKNGQQNRPDYLRLNPKHKVPLLIVDGRTLTENVAINTWVARSFPAARLLPSDPWEELQALSIMAWCSSGIHPFCTRLNSPMKVSDFAGAEESVRRLASGPLLECYGIADEMLAGREFFFDHFTAPDAHFFWCFRRGLQFGLDLSGFKHCNAHFERMKARPSVQKVLAYEAVVQRDLEQAA
ncbi:MAG: glutathione S-transferase family protein, partial [Rhizobiales bacterium]|nr:glutathione S-transferase family protein [Hyphomicrobiales bacterium]